MSWKCGLVLPSDACSALQYNPEWTLGDMVCQATFAIMCATVYLILYATKDFYTFQKKSFDELNKYAFRVAVMTKWCRLIC